MQEQASQSPPSQDSQEHNNADNGSGISGADDTVGRSLQDSVRQLEREHSEQQAKERPQEGQEDQQEQSVKRAPPQPKASAFAALHREKIQVAQEKQALAAQKQEIEQARKMIENAKRSPADAVKAMGYESMKEFLEKVADSGGEMTPEQQKIWDLEERLAAREKAEEEQRSAYQEQQESAKYQQEVAQWHKSIRDYVTEPDSHWANSLVSLEGQEGQVLALIQEQHAQYGENLDLNEALEVALDKVNKHLEKQMRQGIAQIAANPRGQAILNEIVGSVKNNQRSPSNRAQKPSGLTSQVRNETTERRSTKDLSLDEMIELSAAQLRREQARF